MDLTLLILAAMVGGGLFLAARSGLTTTPPSAAALERLEQLAAATPNPLLANVAAVIADGKPQGRWWRRWMDERAARSERVAAFNKRSVAITDVLDRAELQIRPYEWYAILAGISIVVAGLLTLRFMWIAGVVALVLVPTVGGQFYLRHRISKRLRQVDGQLSDVLIQMSNGLKAGFSFMQALNSVVAQARPPLGKDLGRIKLESELGVPLEDALRHFSERVPTEDIDLFVTAVSVTRVLGGNLAQILELIAMTVRERVRIQGEIRTLTAQARASGIIVTLLPFGLAGVLTVIAPDYFSRMFHDPIGWAMIGISIFSMFLGGLIIKKIVTIDV